MYPTKMSEEETVIVVIIPKQDEESVQITKDEITRVLAALHAKAFSIWTNDQVVNVDVCDGTILEVLGFEDDPRT